MKMKKILSFLCVCFMSVGLLGNAGVTAWADDNTIIKNDESGIPDVKLYQVILNAADSNQDGILTVSEAESVKSLDAKGSEIKDIRGIEYLTNVQMLRLDNNQISDIKSLETLTNLRELWLSDNKLKDISSLAKLTNLLALYLGSDLKDIQSGISEQCQISDISPLAGLTNLYYLFLGNSNISDITPLSNLTNLNTISLHGNQVSDISALAKATELFALYLGDNNIRDITPLLQMKNLYTLDVSYNKISEEDITKLETTLTGLKFFTKHGQNPDIPESGWLEGNGTKYWYENGIRQGTYDDPKGVLGDGTVRGREIYDPESDGWYWLDAVYDGAKAVNKEVWMPYIYQNEADWDEAELAANALASGDMAAQVTREIKNKSGKWVRYDANGKMYKGWYTVEGNDTQIYPQQAGNTYYYDPMTGLMAKGEVTIDGQTYYFDEVTGVLQK